MDRIVAEGKIQVIWQTGKYYEREMTEFMQGRSDRGIWRGAFIERMDLAYAAADLVMSRSGAGTVSELCLVARPVLFVPSPNVAEDHQTKNAMALVGKQAARMIPDRDAVNGVFPVVEELLADPKQLAEMERNILTLGIGDSADRVVNEVMDVVNEK